jgi:hypothetical protein
LPLAKDAHRTPAELQELVIAERSGPILVYRDGRKRQRIVRLTEAPDDVSIGRDAGHDLSLDWDDEVSRDHARVHPFRGQWMLDDKDSTNGTRVNGTAISGEKKLKDGDRIRVGRTEITFRAARVGAGASTAAADVPEPVTLNPRPLLVLKELCKPYAQGAVRPATNAEIAAALNLSLPAVKNHLRLLYQRFEIGDLPQNRKRATLAWLAIESGTVSLD